mmetsp:Transcript_10605/g.25631  ORF Transcript_10605/g.25631 Transcript_10605/m.25631 type:complete len:212 (-) Transcript_10605:519-1154(-)
MKAALDAHISLAFVIFINQGCLGSCNSRDAKISYPLRMEIALVLNQICHRHVSVPNGFYLENIVIFGESIKLAMQAIQQIDNFVRRELRRNLVKVNDIGEENCYTVPMLRFNLSALLQGYRNMAARNKGETKRILSDKNAAQFYLQNKETYLGKLACSPMPLPSRLMVFLFSSVDISTAVVSTRFNRVSISSKFGRLSTSSTRQSAIIDWI